MNSLPTNSFSCSFSDIIDSMIDLLISEWASKWIINEWVSEWIKESTGNIKVGEYIIYLNHVILQRGHTCHLRVREYAWFYVYGY